MFSNILNKITKKDMTSENNELIHKISVMNLTEMRAYVNNRVPEYPVNENGLDAVIEKMIKEDESTSKRYINIDDMDVKLKKAFELILLILKNKKIAASTVELANTFVDIFKEIILTYDTKNKQIYESKFNQAISLAVDTINIKSNLTRQMNVVGD